MIDELQNAFANQILADASWMSEETKQKTLEKLQKMTVLVGYPDWIKVILNTSFTLIQDRSHKI